MPDNSIRRPPGSGDVPLKPESEENAPQTRGAHAKGASRAPASGPSGKAEAKDTFGRGERAGAGHTGAPVDARLQAIQSKTATLKVVFTDAEVAELVKIFAEMLAQNPHTERLKRAKLFARAVLKRKKLKKVFASLSEAEMEEMCDGIADVLDSSPVFGQLVDDVTDDTTKNAG